MFDKVSVSLADLTGEDYIRAVVECAVDLHGMDPITAGNIAHERVEFFSDDRRKKLESLLPFIGQARVAPLHAPNPGAPTNSYRKASNLKAAPVGGIGCFRIGEDGRVYLTAKSEHYHTPLGHNFQGYRLIDNARRLGIDNATHNNTRGSITRRLECELIRCTNGLERSDVENLASVLASSEKKMLNRVINLETGSLAVEAGIKMMLSRFYRLDATFAEPRYAGKIPVFLVMGDNDGGLEANYHGTTVMTQMFRGMWPELYEQNEKNGLFKTVGVRINDAADFRDKIAKYNSGAYRTAGFLHEIILMNYGGIRLNEAYLQEVYRLCETFNTPVLVDEIQSCMWYKGMFLFRLYGLRPDFVVLGKGFSGGESPASKIITTSEMDTLSQFGALVTNGQEELASLAYLITMEFAQRNADVIQELGDYFEGRLSELFHKHGECIVRIEGKGHLATIHFDTVEETLEFSRLMNARCIDVSAQTYKANCPPAALMKIPIIMDRTMIDHLLGAIDETLQKMQENS